MGDRLRRWIDRDRLALGVIAIGSLVATIAWRGMSKPMVDTVGYRATVVSLETGWHEANDRLIGYPLVLMATGSGHHSTHLLFFLQLAMHAACVLLVIDLARRVGIGRWGRAAIALLLYAPVVLVRVVQEGTEVLAALLLTLVFWMLLTPSRSGHRVRWALGLGLLCGVSALVRPTFTLLFIPVMVIAARAVPARRWRTAGLVALPALILVGGWIVINGLRFDLWSTTPNTAFNLNSRSSTYVERLPASFEPGRSVLIEERDEALLLGEAFPPENYIYRARPALEEATGLRGRALERYIMRVDLYLILHHPFNYLEAVKVSSLNYSSIDGSPAVGDFGEPVAWAETGIHQLLLAAFFGVFALVPGLALAGRVERRHLRLFAVGFALAGYTFLVTVMIEAGVARLRAPTEPILALVFVLGASIVRAAWRARRASVPVEAPAP